MSNDGDGSARGRDRTGCTVNGAPPELEGVDRAVAIADERLAKAARWLGFIRRGVRGGNADQVRREPADISSADDEDTPATELMVLSGSGG